MISYITNWHKLFDSDSIVLNDYFYHSLFKKIFRLSLSEYRLAVLRINYSLMIFQVVWGNYRYQTAGFEFFTYKVYALINLLRYAIRYQFMEIILGFIVYSNRMYVTILRCPIQPYIFSRVK